MSVKKIKQHNDQKFLNDLKRVRDVVVMPTSSDIVLHVAKGELKKKAESKKIHYFITDKIFVIVRDAMVII